MTGAGRVKERRMSESLVLVVESRFWNQANNVPSYCLCLIDRQGHPQVHHRDMLADHGFAVVEEAGHRLALWDLDRCRQAVGGWVWAAGTVIAARSEGEPGDRSSEPEVEWERQRQLERVGTSVVAVAVVVVVVEAFGAGRRWHWVPHTIHGR